MLTQPLRVWGAALAAALAACALVVAFALHAPTAAAAPQALPGPQEARAWVTPGSTNPDCTESCHHWVVHWEDLGPGTHQVACWAGDTSSHGGPASWHDIITHSTTWAGSAKFSVEGASGSRQLSCYLGESYNGTAVGVMVDGVLHTSGTWNS